MSPSGTELVEEAMCLMQIWERSRDAPQGDPGQARAYRHRLLGLSSAFPGTTASSGCPGTSDWPLVPLEGNHQGEEGAGEEGWGRPVAAELRLPRLSASCERRGDVPAISVGQFSFWRAFLDLPVFHSLLMSLNLALSLPFCVF